MRTNEQAYFQYIKGHVYEELWEGQSADLRQLLQSPGVKKRVVKEKGFFGQRFQTYMDDLTVKGSDVPPPTEIVQEMS